MCQLYYYIISDNMSPAFESPSVIEIQLIGNSVVLILIIRYLILHVHYFEVSLVVNQQLLGNVKANK